MRVIYYDVKRSEEFEHKFNQPVMLSASEASRRDLPRSSETTGIPATGGGLGTSASPQDDVIRAEYRANVDDIFREADFVSIHVPLLAATHHLVNAERLRLMKPTAYLINTSRGPIVDEIALRDALKAGVIKGAAIDVWEHEPELTPGLTDLENIIITPHTASATEETRQKMGELAAKNIIEALEGRTPPNLISS